MTRKRSGIGYQIRLKPQELALLIRGLDLLLDANRRDPAILGLFPREAADIIASLQARLAMTVLRLPEGGWHGGPSPRVRLNGLDLTVSSRALEQLECELKKNPDLLSPVSVSAAASLATRLKAKIGVYLMRSSALEEE